MTCQQFVFTIILLISSRIYAMPQDIVFPGEPFPFPTTTEAVTESTSISWTTVALPSNYYACLHDCGTISSYKPVCGTDGVVYQNIYKLQCANFCGNDVRFFQKGLCRPRRTLTTAAPNV